MRTHPIAEGQDVFDKQEPESTGFQYKGIGKVDKERRQIGEG